MSPPTGSRKKKKKNDRRRCCYHVELKQQQQNNKNNNKKQKRERIEGKNANQLKQRRSFKMLTIRTTTTKKTKAKEKKS